MRSDNKVPLEGTEEKTHPPVTHQAHPSGGTTRPTVQVRPQVRPRVWRGHPGFPLDSLYVRRYWTAAIGPTALCDLLRLARAGEQGIRIPLPDRAHALLAFGLAHRDGHGRFAVPDRLPEIPLHLRRRWPLHLRREHDQYLRGLRSQG